MSSRRFRDKVNASSDNQPHSVELVAWLLGSIMSEGIRLIKNDHLTNAVAVVVELYHECMVRWSLDMFAPIIGF